MTSFAVPIPYNIVNGKKMFKRSDLWRHQYRVNRYMPNLSQHELDERNNDIMSNLTTLTPEGQLGLELPRKESLFPWTELWTHILEEYVLRGTGMHAGLIRQAQIPEIPVEGPAKGTNALKQRRITTKNKLIKFGKEEHLHNSLLTGKWRIAPASSYQGDSCRARQDSELELSYCLSAFQRHPQATNEPDEIYPNKLMMVLPCKVQAPGDYYTACFARTFVHRLFDDFKADSCLIVMDEEVFTRRMMKAFAESSPRWKGYCRRVDYVDPLLPSRHPNVHFAKHFRYAYQDEFRFVWAPKPSVAKLEPLFIEMGPLTDCCELLTSQEVNS